MHFERLATLHLWICQEGKLTWWQVEEWYAGGLRDWLEGPGRWVRFAKAQEIYKSRFITLKDEAPSKLKHYQFLIIWALSPRVILYRSWVFFRLSLFFPGRWLELQGIFSEMKTPKERGRLQNAEVWPNGERWFQARSGGSGRVSWWLMEHPRSDGTKFTTRQLRGPKNWNSSYWLLESLFLGLRCLPETADYWQFLYASK